MYDDRTFRSLCADTFRSPFTRDALPARGKQMVHVEFGTAALEVTATLPDKRLRGPVPVDAARRHWIVRLPRRLERTSVLSFGARFAQGGVPYGVTLRRVGGEQYDRPKRPILESLDRRIRAARGSSCWRTTGEDGVTTAVCGEVFPPQPSTPLKVRSGGAIRIDMRMPTQSLTARLGGGRQLAPTRLSDGGRRWRIQLPREFRRKRMLHLFAIYPQGDSVFTATLHKRANE
jgi:hypothetical protein